MDPEYECPLCGSLMRLSNDVYYYDDYEREWRPAPYWECPSCPLATSPQYSEEDAKDELLSLLSQFSQQSS